MMYLISLIFSLPCFEASFATTFSETTFDEIFAKSKIVVEGTVGRSYSEWQNDQIVTLTEFTVEHELVGQVSTTKILLMQPGGEKDGIGMNVEGTAQFSAGEFAILALNAGSNSDVYWPRGMMMGKLVLNSNGYIQGPVLKNKKLPRGEFIKLLTQNESRTLESKAQEPKQLAQAEVLVEKKPFVPTILAWSFGIILLIAGGMMLLRK